MVELAHGGLVTNGDNSSTIIIYPPRGRWNKKLYNVTELYGNTKSKYEEKNPAYGRQSIS